MKVKREVPEELYILGAAKGIPRRNVYSRYVDLGWDEEKIISTPVMNRSEIGKASGRARESLFTEEEKQLIKSRGMSINAVRRRINVFGWNKQEAIDTPIMSRSKAGALGNAVMRGKISSRRMEVQSPEEVIELPDYEYQKKRLEILAAIDKAETQLEYERLGAELLAIRKSKA